MNDRFLRACRRQPVDRTPIWIMRQAGRYLPEYREVRRKVDFVTLCRTPELACEVTLQPIDRLGVDAAILFSDILVPAESMGFEIDFNPGPVLGHAVRSRADVEAVRTPDGPEVAPYVYDAVRLIRKELDGRVPLIGFAAAPWTLAVYLVEGRGSKHFDQIKRMIFGDPASAHALLGKITTVTIGYLREQVAAGAQALQLFDSWAGILGPAEYREFALPYAERVLQAIADLDVPRIYFALNNSHLLDEVGTCSADVLGMDWRVPLEEANRRLGGRFALQGNLDPCTLMATPETIADRARAVVEAGRQAPGHVFNLGHGILPDTPPEHAVALVEAVHQAVPEGA
jgi:uroporphyrinogen decarboxylase